MISSIPNIFSLARGGQQQAVRDAYAQNFGRDVADAQRATGAASLRTGMSPAAAARQYAVQQQGAMAQRAEARSRALAQAKVADDGMLTRLLGLGLGAAGTIGAYKVAEDQAETQRAHELAVARAQTPRAAAPAAPVAAAPTTAPTTRLAAPSPVPGQPSPSPQAQRTEEEDPLGPLAMLLRPVGGVMG